jgi:coenzyme F420 hydrogenase subunit beta
MTKRDAFDPNAIVAQGLCTGCGLCAATSGGAITMTFNASGYLRPVLDAGSSLAAPLQAELAKACPAMHMAHERRSTPPTHVLWGPVVGTHAGHASDPALRQQGSSGGMISALACHLLATGQVDGVAQIAVSTDDPLRNDLQISRSRADVLRAAGSRYAPAAPLAPLLAHLHAGERLAFVGKPCDVAALRQYLRGHPALAERVPVMLSFMCAGVPSLHGTHAVLTAMGTDRSKLASFRYRGDGWPGMARAVQTDGEAFEMDYNTSWGQILGKHLQFRCKICPDGTGEFADVVCADAWYGKDGYPDFAERDGRSLLLVRTAAGQALVQAALAAGAIATEPLAIDEIERMQPYQATRKRMVLGRTLAARLALGAAPRYRRMGLCRAALTASPLDWLRQAWGTFRRARPEPQ